MPRVVLETNIYVSAFQFGGRPATLLQMALDGEIQVAISQPIIEETLRTLRNKFGWQQTDLEGATTVIESCTTRVTPKQIATAVKDDPDDDRILECAIEAKAQVLITGDSHLLVLKQYEGIVIQRASDFLAGGGI